MATARINSSGAVVSCSKCGYQTSPADRFCNKCGAPIAGPLVSDQGSQVSGASEFDRLLRVAWSCLKDVETKADEIRKAKDVGDQEIKEGTFRGTLSAAALQGRLEKDFHDSLNIAWNSAARAAQIDSGGSVQIEGATITPNVVLGSVCGLRGDLKFALERWEESVGLYQQALQYIPENPAFYFNIGAAYTNKHDAAAAIAAFQTVIRLDPTGRDGIEAAKNVEKLKSGAIGKKGFTGSWKVVAVLGGLSLLFLLSAGRQPGPGIMGLLVFGGILALYWWRKFK